LKRNKVLPDPHTPSCHTLAPDGTNSTTVSPLSAPTGASYAHVKLCVSPEAQADLHYGAIHEYCIPNDVNGESIPRLGYDGNLYCGNETGLVPPIDEADRDEDGCDCPLYYDYAALSNFSSTALESVEIVYETVQADRAWPLDKPITVSGECRCEKEDYRPVWLAPIDLCNYVNSSANASELLYNEDTRTVFERACSLPEEVQNAEFMHVKFCASTDFVTELFYTEKYCRTKDEGTPILAEDGLLFCQTRGYEEPDPTFVLMKCWVSTEGQPTSAWGSLTQYGSFKYARMYNFQDGVRRPARHDGSRLRFYGQHKPLSGLFELTGWNDNYGRNLNVGTLKQVCDETVDVRGSKGAFFLAPRTGCIDSGGISGIAGVQGNFNKCGYFPTSGGGTVSLPEQSIDDHHTYVIFGDSLSDHYGQQKLWFRLGLAWSPTYPGTFSNGNIWSTWLAKGLRSSWSPNVYDGSGDAADGVDPIRGYTSYAVGAAQVDNIEEGPGELPGKFMDEAKRIVMNWLGGDLHDQIRAFDDAQQEFGDPFRVVLGRDKCKADAPSCSTPNSMCQKSSCPEVGECSHYTCVCKPGYVERDGACVPHEDAELPTLSQGGPFALIWAGANDLMGPTRLTDARAIFLDTEACAGVTYKCACTQSAPLCKDDGYCYDNKWDRNGEPCSRESDQCQWSSRAERYCASQIVTRVVRDLLENLDSLYLRGFRNFAVANLPDLGIVPSALQDPGLDASDVPEEFQYYLNEDCRAVHPEHRGAHICRNGANYYRSERMSNVTVEFNTLLALETQKWQYAHTDTSLTVVDIYRAFNLMLNSKLQLKNGVVEDYSFPLDTHRFRIIEIPNKPPIRVWESCTDGGGVGLTGYIWNRNLPVCPEQDRAVFWDNVHPTSRVHCYIAYAWHLAIHEQTGKWPEPDVQGYKRMMSATQAWHGKT
jgi:phospholipase/lecithinase/hemolysin